MKKIVFRFAVIAAGLRLLSPLAAAAAGPTGKPNVIIIVSDNQGYRDLGCFGSKEVITPNFDRMAAEGVKATTFYATSPPLAFL